MRTLTLLGATGSVGESTLDHPQLEALPARATVILLRAVPNHPPAPESLERAATLRSMGFRFGLLLGRFLEDETGLET